MNSIDEIFSKSKRDNQFKGYAKTEEMGEKISLAKINASSVLIPILFFEVLVSENDHNIFCTLNFMVK